MSELIERARELRRVIVANAQVAQTDAEARNTMELYDEWKPDIYVTEGQRLRYKGELYKVYEGKSHTTQEAWAPDVATSLFFKIDEVHSGTKEDPIPYSGNMVLENGKYYTQDGVLYECFRDTGNAVFNPLSELVNLYVSVVSE